MIKHLTLISLTFVIVQSSIAQDLEIFGLERWLLQFQDGPDSVITPEWETHPYEYAAFVEISNTTFNQLQVSGGAAILPIVLEEEDDETFYEGAVDFATLSELLAATPTGTYTFSGQDGSGNNFSIDTQFGSGEIPSGKRFTNWQDLQGVDPSKSITVEFDSFEDFPGVAGLMFFEVSYWDGNDSVSILIPEDNRTDGLPGLIDSTSSITIPADLLQGSPWDTYDVILTYTSVLTMSDGPSLFPNSMLVTTYNYELQTQITVNAPTETWAGYDVLPDNNVDTGNFLGWINVQFKPYVWNWSLSKYIVVPEEYVGPSGSWTYIPKN